MKENLQEQLDHEIDEDSKEILRINIKDMELYETLQSLSDNEYIDIEIKPNIFIRSPKWIIKNYPDIQKRINERKQNITEISFLESKLLNHSLLLPDENNKGQN